MLIETECTCPLISSSILYVLIHGLLAHSSVLTYIHVVCLVLQLPSKLEVGIWGEGTPTNNNQHC